MVANEFRTQAEETMKISGWFTMQWYDYRLRWNSTDFDGVTQIDFVSDELWRPDVGLMNGKHSHYFDFSADQHSRINIDYEGRITWLLGAVLDVACPLDFADFPFDTQVCHLIITPWQSSMRQLKLLPMQHGPAVDNYFLPNSNVSEWEIQSIKFELELYRSQFGVNYQYINISIQLRRQPLYFIILVLVPFMMLSILACLIFTLDDTGDRLSVALSLILSMTMYVVIVSSNAPRSMRTVPLLGIFLLDQLGLLCIATVIAVLSNKLHQYKDPNISPMDLFLLNKTPTTYDMTMENYNSHDTTSPEESDEFLQAPSEDASLNGETADPYTQNSGKFRPTQDALGFPRPSVDDISLVFLTQGIRLANIQQESPIFLPRHSALSINLPDGRQRISDVNAMPTRIVQANFAAPLKSKNDNLFRKLYKLGRKLFQPGSVGFRRNVSAGIDNMGILVYLFATLMNAVFCLIIMPGRER
ncbi:putative nachr subunit [Fasciola hepatica]|uniref:Nachr subunit n=1 Tax=Fasciola hepatica TaxID=6192 RepID=A0A4E0S194_FASHE|nr:putative nachr subunit [Fasciola hepatica]